jgi:hypothetical protein
MSTKNLPSVQLKKGLKDFHSSICFVNGQPEWGTITLLETKPKKNKIRRVSFDLKTQELQQLFDMFKSEGLVK